MIDFLISIIIPVYNIEKHIGKCLDSLVAQTYSNIEIILVDDGSKDKSGSICQDWQKKDSRIKYFLKENGGPSSARNYGIEKSSGDYVAFVDGDDYVDPDYIESMLIKALDYRADLVISSCVHEGIVVGKEKQQELGKLSSSETGRLMLSAQIRGYLPCKLFARSILQGYRINEKIHILEDIEYILRILLSSSFYCYVSEKCMYHYVHRQGSQTTNELMDYTESYEELLKSFESFEKDEFLQFRIALTLINESYMLLRTSNNKQLIKRNKRKLREIGTNKLFTKDMKKKMFALNFPFIIRTIYKTKRFL